MASKIVVGRSGIHGKGVFAKRDIKKGEVVFIFKGKPVRWKVHDQKSSLHGQNWVGLSKEKWLDVISPGVFTNHSCDPSCGIRGRKKVTALRNIKKGEEITIDYSITEMDTLWHMKCRCGSKNCRGEIRSIQSLPKKTFDKYFPYIPTYFMKVYNRDHDGRKVFR